MLHHPGRELSVSDRTAAAVLDAAREQLLTFGVRRLTIEDVARRAGVARITVYRRFGAKDELVQAVVLREAQQFFAALESAIAPYDGLGDRVTEGFAFTLYYLREHSLLTRLLRTEPEAILPYATIGAGPLLAVARHNLAALFGEDLRDGRNEMDIDVLTELLARLVLSFLLTPQSAVALETEDDARAFARKVLLPILDPGAPNER